TSVAVKKVNDIMRLESLVDKKKVIITEDTIRDARRLDDAEGVECLPNEEIFIDFVRNMDSSTKFYMYPRFLQIMIRKQVGDLSSHTTKYTSHALTQKVFAKIKRVGVVSAANDEVPTTVEEPSILSPTPPTSPPQPSQDQPLTSQVQLTPLQSPQDKIAQALEITKLKSRVKKLERRNKASKLKRLKRVGTTQSIETSDDTVMDDVSKQGRMIADMDADVDMTLKDVAADVKDVADQDAKIDESANVLSMQDDEESEPAELQEVVEVVTTAKLITEVVTAASATLTAATPQLTTAAAQTLTTAPSAARRRKGVLIRDHQETATPSTIIHSEAKSKDKGKGILAEEPKPLKKQAQIEQYEANDRELKAELN
nr:hypothetical protein [Tanacetum cinerariifolium]